MRFFFPIESAVILKVTGRDCTRYLHARLTNDIRALAIGSSCIAAALTPQGKPQALFNVTKLGEAEYILTADGGTKQEIILALLKFKVADRVEVEDLSERYSLTHCVGLEEQSLFLDGIIISKRERSLFSGFDILCPTSSNDYLQKLILGIKRLTQKERDYLRVQALKPEFPNEINDSSLLLETGPREAISFVKGCYAGQEVLEKIDSHGKLPSQLVLLELVDGEFNPEEKGIFVHDSKAGRVLLYAQGDGESLALALILSRYLDGQLEYKIKDSKYLILKKSKS